jgi:ribosomal-protein-alanine N-acetyltransferase
MLHMIETARQLGASRMTLEVRRSNEVAKSLYASLGFVQKGVRRGYYSNNKEDALIYWANIDNND